MPINQMVVDRPTFVSFNIPADALCLGSQLQRGMLVMYCAVYLECNPPLKRVDVAVIGTGYEMGDELKPGNFLYDGTFLDAPSGLVAHVFIKVNHPE